ncbi:hypothetical protein pclt_cds_666 [Pandoravirus celtis]|uniref:Uncharacterized protein n=1 Tax=Pandoravirus celtis TaxID=2568002 RepID=A0A4D6EIU9_9VIRU|nr:hypothetical protein pclt_cds_666 [Pandoravirus celtis]
MDQPISLADTIFNLSEHNLRLALVRCSATRKRRPASTKTHRMTMYGNHLLNDIPTRSLLGCATIAVGLAIVYILAAPAIAVVAAWRRLCFDRRGACCQPTRGEVAIHSPAIPGDPSAAQAPMDYSYYCDDYDVDVDQPRYCTISTHGHTMAPILRCAVLLLLRPQPSL